MKKLILATLFLSQYAYPSGVLVTTPNYFVAHGKILPSAGLGIYERLDHDFYYDSYTGIGLSPRFDAADVSWVVSRHDIGRHFGNLNLSIGAALKLSDQPFAGPEDESNVHVTVAWKLWE